MVIEWLKFTVDSNSREQFIQKDEAIWTANLATYSGFLGKEVWIEPDAPGKVIFTIRWETRQQWKSIPLEDLVAIEKEFSTVMKQMNIKYKMIETKEFQIRKFPNNVSP
ncbi:TIGR03792 family protein [Waterburya agarophytonicola K14]|uniref:TIGR03792 family protein n=1 Tax=Waterburya agarophytonicola KI4 TaxID=2874699 RepID=A0A964FH39_9CYAN|nr:TIGR03792 family protein [Waterburya agarophytonicola]MCC0178766.1 TIGR03792 family protein [Waterburya agarophytonicola KI4]